ncbi:MAG: hypothetical protein ACXVDA_14570 [Ktedonobacterales bacterium]
MVKAFNEDSYGGSFPDLRKALGDAKMSTVIVDSSELKVKLSVVAANGEIIEFLEPIDEFPSATLLAQVMLIV